MDSPSASVALVTAHESVSPSRTVVGLRLTLLMTGAVLEMVRVSARAVPVEVPS